MTLDPEVEKVLQEELRIYGEVRDSLRAQRQSVAGRLSTEARRAQSLTADMVATRRDSDRAMLASDEAVSHALADKGIADMAVLDKLVEKPYFARFAVREEQRPGTFKEFEYKLGVAANPDCRIIDWRKGPISKLYYEYKEGEEYSEEIQGRERNGTITLRNSVEVTKGELSKIVCRHGSLLRRADGWHLAGGKGARTGEQGYGQLREVLPLITPEQFRMITEEATTAVLIQGIAGSGKTTVALHRLAWLLHPDNGTLLPREALVIALSKPLKRFIELSMSALQVSGVPVFTFAEWAAQTVASLAPDSVDHLGEGEQRRVEVRRLSTRAPHSIERVKRSMAMLRAVEQLHSGAGAQMSARELITAVLSNANVLLQLDETRLLSREVIALARARADLLAAERCFDPADDALLLRIYQLRHGGVALPTGEVGRLKHLVVDEIQEFSPTELAAIVSAVESPSQLTLVGDLSQRTSATSSFPGWEKLRSTWNLGDSMSRYVSLTISHRSTLEIMKLADYVQERTLVTDGRRGRPPIWFHSMKEERTFPTVVNWLTKAIERYPSSLTAVICSSASEARQVLSLLEPTFGQAVRLGSEDAFSFQEGIVVTDVAQVKGVEFTNVVLWNPTRKSYPPGEESRNAVYVAISRAEENLCIATWGIPADMLPSVRSPLVRGYELDIQFDEAEAAEKEERRRERAES